MSNYSKLANDSYRYALQCKELANVPMVCIESDADGSLASSYIIGEQSRNNGTGACISFLPVRAIAQSSTGPCLRVPVEALVQVNPQANTTGLNADEIAVLLVTAINGVYIEGTGVFFVEGNPIVPNVEFLPLITREVSLLNTVKMIPPERCAQPTISATGQTVTLAPSSGDDCYYSTDGTFPDPSTATLYSGPFTLPVGTIVRWAGFNATKNPSAIGQAEITA